MSDALLCLDRHSSPFNSRILSSHAPLAERSFRQLNPSSATQEGCSSSIVPSPHYNLLLPRRTTPTYSTLPFNVDVCDTCRAGNNTRRKQHRAAHERISHFGRRFRTLIGTATCTVLPLPQRDVAPPAARQRAATPTLGVPHGCPRRLSPRMLRCHGCLYRATCRAKRPAQARACGGQINRHHRPPGHLRQAAPGPTPVLPGRDDLRPRGCRDSVHTTPSYSLAMASRFIRAGVCRCSPLRGLGRATQPGPCTISRRILLRTDSTHLHFACHFRQENTSSFRTIWHVPRSHCTSGTPLLPPSTSTSHHRTTPLPPPTLL